MYPIQILGSCRPAFFKNEKAKSVSSQFTITTSTHPFRDLQKGSLKQQTGGQWRERERGAKDRLKLPPANPCIISSLWSSVHLTHALDGTKGCQQTKNRIDLFFVKKKRSLRTPFCFRSWLNERFLILFLSWLLPSFLLFYRISTPTPSPQAAIA